MGNPLVVARLANQRPNLLGIRCDKRRRSRLSCRGDVMLVTEGHDTEDAFFPSRRAGRFVLASVGTAVAVMLLVVWAVSARLCLGYSLHPPVKDGGYYFVSFNSGLVTLCHGHYGCWGSSYCYCAEEWCEGRLRWTPVFEVDVEPLATTIQVALWVPFVLIAIPTAILWCSIRRRPPPHCCQHCGYDLTGNVSGICPECGAEVARIGQEDSSGPAAS